MRRVSAITTLNSQYNTRNTKQNIEDECKFFPIFSECSEVMTVKSDNDTIVTDHQVFSVKTHACKGSHDFGCCSVINSCNEMVLYAQPSKQSFCSTVDMKTIKTYNLNMDNIQNYLVDPDSVVITEFVDNIVIQNNGYNKDQGLIQGNNIIVSTNSLLFHYIIDKDIQEGDTKVNVQLKQDQVYNQNRITKNNLIFKKRIEKYDIIKKNKGMLDPIAIYKDSKNNSNLLLLHTTKTSRSDYYDIYIVELETLKLVKKLMIQSNLIKLYYKEINNNYCTHIVSSYSLNNKYNSVSVTQLFNTYNEIFKFKLKFKIKCMAVNHEKNIIAINEWSDPFVHLYSLKTGYEVKKICPLMQTSVNNYFIHNMYFFKNILVYNNTNNILEASLIVYKEEEEYEYEMPENMQMFFMN